MSKHDERLQQFADELVKKIEANEAPWQKGWVSGLGDILPVNHQGKPYRGNNLFELMMTAQAKGYSDNRWYTFNNAKDYGGYVRKGEKGTVITFFSRTKTENKKDEQGNTILDKDGKPVKVTMVLERPVITTAVVFNAEQIEGLPPRVMTTPLSEWERHEKAENIVKAIQAQGVTIEHKFGDRAFYRPSDDVIVMPERGQFPTPDAYYATLLHEIGHSTGHKDRLNRDLSGSFGSESYAKEELRAEIASMIVGEQLEIGYDPSQHHAYLQSWVKVIKEDPKEIFRAVKDADEISSYVMGLGREIEIAKIEVPAHENNFQPMESQQTVSPPIINVPDKSINQMQTTQMQQDKRIYLYTSYEDLSDLQKLNKAGITKFDAEYKVWYAQEKDQQAVSAYLTAPFIPRPEDEFADYLHSMGINVEAGHPIFDDRPHRLSNAGSTAKNVMYQAYENPHGVPFARVTNFSKGGSPENWQYSTEYLSQLRNIEAVESAYLNSSKTADAPSRTNAVQKNQNAKQPTAKNEIWENSSSNQSAKEQDNEAKKIKSDLMASISKMVISISEVAPPTQNYLSKKQVTANDTVRIIPDSSKLPHEYKHLVMIADTFKQAQHYRQNNPDKLVLQRGNLAIPQYNTQGELRAFETISYVGGKYALKDADKQGLMTPLGTLENGKPIIITEGYATGATLHEYTRQDKPAVVVAFGRGGLMEVTQKLRESYPDSKIYIGADNDHQKPLEIDPATRKPKINQGLEDAQKVASITSKTHVLLPNFNQGDIGKDWNDIYVDKGADEFKRQVIEQLNTINHVNVGKKQSNKEPVAIQPALPEPIKTQSISLIERLASESVKEKYPSISEDNINAIQAWREHLPIKYENEPIKAHFALERLEAKLSDYANGEVLPPPKLDQQETEPPDKGVIR